MSLIFDSVWAESIRNTTQGRFSMKQSNATLTGYIDTSVMVTESNQLINEVLGYCQADGTGKITRNLPLAHPQYRGLYASDLAIRGISFNGKADSSPSLYEAQPIGYYAKYRAFEYTIGFTSRPYILLRDDSIETTDIYYYEKDGTPAVEYRVPKEYLRFTDYDDLPAAEYLTAQQGQFTFKRSDTTAPNDYAVPGSVRMIQQKSMIKFRWYQVPNHYLTSVDSFIKAGLGHVNQLDWNGWKAGTLLMMACAPIDRYTPPNPEYDILTSPAVASNAKLVDLEFTFLHFDPGTLTGGEAPPTPDNLSYVTGGHNLLPWLAAGGGKYFYAIGGAQTNYSPLYPSFPFQLFFKDPDVA